MNNIIGLRPLHTESIFIYFLQDFRCDKHTNDPPSSRAEFSLVAHSSTNVAWLAKAGLAEAGRHEKFGSCFRGVSFQLTGKMICQLVVVGAGCESVHPGAASSLYFKNLM